jgi:aminopeptidase N
MKATLTLFFKTKHGKLCAFQNELHQTEALIQSDRLVFIRFISYIIQMIRRKSSQTSLVKKGIRATGIILFLVSLILTGFPLLEANDSGGPLMTEQEAYDVTFYDLFVDLNVQTKSFAGTLLVTAEILSPLSAFVLDLDPVFKIQQVKRLNLPGENRDLEFQWENEQIRISLDQTLEPGSTVVLEIVYTGQPREAPSPPWQGGFVWEAAENGLTWLGTACEFEGADTWWPCKDHPSDEPDSMAMHFRVPDDLVCVSNGTLRGIEDHGDGSRTWYWFSSTPINIYNVTLNLAPYQQYEDTIISISGDTIPISLYLNPANAAQASFFIGEMKRTLSFLEHHFGPYPFRIDKYAVAQTSYLGMEHQTVISYGSNFEPNEFGFDEILFHETAHEWWGNLITCSDWRDLWLHEGFATYTEALYAEYLRGTPALHEYVASHFTPLRNQHPVAPAEPTSFKSIFGLDVYYKGARVLHSLRYLLGDKLFFDLLRKMCYPTPVSEAIKSGAQCRSVSSEDFIQLAEDLSGKNLSWFFNVYLREPALPKLKAQVVDSTLHLEWITGTSDPFLMPLTILTGDTETVVRMENGTGQIELSSPVFQIDPLGWILKDTLETSLEETRAQPVRSELTSVFPNPFNEKTTMQLTVGINEHLTLKIVNNQGQTVDCLLNRTMTPGTYYLQWAARNVPSGVYFIHLVASTGVKNRKLILIK